MAKPSARFVLGSSSARRLDLLKSVGLVPDVVKGPDIDETPRKGELPKAYVMRMAKEKNAALAKEFVNDYLLTADTSIAVGRRIIGKCTTEAEQRKIMQLLSGRNHKVISVVMLRAPNGKTVSRTQISVVKFKRLSDADIDAFIDKKDWQGVAVYKLGYMIDRYIESIKGSPSGIIGLPLFETSQLLKGLGYGD